MTEVSLVGRVPAHYFRGVHPAITSPTPLRATAGRVIIALWLGAIVYVVALSTIVTRAAGGRATLRQPVIEEIVLLLLWGIATPAILWSAEHLPVERQRWRQRVLQHAGFSTAFIFAITIVGPALAWMARRGPTPIHRR